MIVRIVNSGWVFEYIYLILFLIFHVIQISDVLSSFYIYILPW
jgi:hypothetical protein